MPTTVERRPQARLDDRWLCPWISSRSGYRTASPTGCTGAGHDPRIRDWYTEIDRIELEFHYR
jgi:hypothetical protein